MKNIFLLHVIHVRIYEVCCVTRGLNASTNSIDSGQPSLTLYHKMPYFNENGEKKRFENIVGKRENAGNFLPFPQFFLHYTFKGSRQKFLKP